VFGKTDGHLIEGQLYDPSKIAGKPYFCWILLSPMCMHSLKTAADANHLPLIFLGDLARMALGEMEPSALF